MLLPQFELHQDEQFLIVIVKVPYAKVSETDIHFEDFDFKFYCKPYFLKLQLPGRVLFREEPNVTYDVDSSQFTIYAPKANVGEVFEGLEFLTSMLVPKKQLQSGVPRIEVIGEASQADADDFEEFDMNFYTTDPETDSFLLKERLCGFGNQYSSEVFRLKEETSVIFDVVDPYKKSIEMCQQERIEKEISDFSDNHYLADLYENEEILGLIGYKAEWDRLCEIDNPKISFTREEKDKLLHLPNKEYLLDHVQQRGVYLGLLDILLSYAYNHRITEGENNSESGWNINKLSATLSWMEVFSSPHEVIKSFVQRSLTYPLFRNWDLAMTVIQDVVHILGLGRKYVLKCFLEIHSLFSASDPRYILNDLYITDYCIWMQLKRCNSDSFTKLAIAVDQVKLEKKDLDLDLVDLENAAKAVLEESSQELNDVCSSMSNIGVN